MNHKLHDAEEREWEGLRFEIVVYLGQTEFHSTILGEIDGRRVIFSGDSTCPLKRYQPEREKERMVSTVIRNSLTFDMYRKCAEECERLRPNLLCPGHGPYVDVPAKAFEEHQRYVREKESIWRGLLSKPAALGPDLLLCRLVSCQSTIESGQTRRLALQLRNSFETTVQSEAALDSALHISTTHPRGGLLLEANQKGEIDFQVTMNDDIPDNSRHT